MSNKIQDIIIDKLEMEITRDLGSPYHEKDPVTPDLSSYSEDEMLFHYRQSFQYQNQGSVVKNKYWKLLLKYKAEINALENKLNVNS